MSLGSLTDRLKVTFLWSCYISSGISMCIE